TPPRAVARAAPLAAQTLRHSVARCGCEAGNPALTVMAPGGVYLGGGIAPRRLPALRDGGFRDRSLAKGRMRPLLEAMPVHVVLNDQAALLGAGRCAAIRARS